MVRPVKSPAGSSVPGYLGLGCLEVEHFDVVYTGEEHVCGIYPDLEHFSLLCFTGFDFSSGDLFSRFIVSCVVVCVFKFQVV